MLQWPAKDPDEILDYEIDWSDRLGSDTLASATFSLVTAAGLVITDQLHDATTATVWLSGGTLGETAQIQCRAVTAGGRTLDQTVSLDIASK